MRNVPLLGLSVAIFGCTAVTTSHYERVGVTEEPILSYQDAAPHLTGFLDQDVRLFPMEDLTDAEGNRWNPRRRFGPFSSAPDLGQIKVWMDGPSTRWYYNSYLQNHPKKAIYQKYYGPDLPSDRSPDAPERVSDPADRPNCPSGPCFNNVLMSLHSISYSSKYGSSLQLQFYADDDTEYDIGDGGTSYWDVNGIGMAIFVTIRKESLNPMTPDRVVPSGRQHPFKTYRNHVHVEFSGRPLAQYSDVLIEAPFSPEPETLASRDEPLDETKLREALQKIADDIVRRFDTGGPTAQAFTFVHAFLHTQFPDLIGENEEVDSIEIYDGYVKIVTSEREPMFSIQVGVSNLADPTSGYHESEHEFLVSADAVHNYNGIRVPGPHNVLATRPQGLSSAQSYYGYFGTWPLRGPGGCDSLSGIEFSFVPHEQDPLYGDSYRRISVGWEVNDLACAGIASAVEKKLVGTIEEWGGWHDLIPTDGFDAWGRIAFSFRVVLSYE